MADSDDERDRMQCDDRRFEAKVRGDVAALRMGLSDHLTYTYTSGAHETKAPFLDSLTIGQLSYKSIIPEARSVRVYGGAGIVTGTARMEITARGQDARVRLRYIAVYVKAEGSLAAGGVAIHACTRSRGGVPGRLWSYSPLLSAPGPPVSSNSLGRAWRRPTRSLRSTGRWTPGSSLPAPSGPCRRSSAPVAGKRCRAAGRRVRASAHPPAG